MFVIEPFATDVGDAEAGLRRPSSIYDTYSTRQRWTILAAISFAAILAPFSDTIYLPALTVVAESLNTTLELVTTSVSIYMYMVGGAVLIWGPLCDRYGRRITYLSSSALFVAASVACAVAPNIGMLIAFRAVQGAAVTTLSTCGGGVIADVFPPASRGLANGVFVVPMMLGPLLGPVLGGVLSQGLGWRATFVALVIFGGCALVALALLLPETHQWYVLKRLREEDPSKAATIVEAPSIHPPAFPSPLTPLLIIASKDVVVHALSLTAVFSFLFCIATVMPIALAQPPFSLSQAIIGVAYLPSGFASMLFAPIAGWLADLLARRYGGTAVRLVPGIVASGTVIPMALLGFGWSLRAGSLGGALASSFAVGVGCSFAMPGMFSWLTIVQQSRVAAAMAGINSVLNLGAGSFVQAAAPGTSAMGYGPFFTMLAGVQVAVALAAGVTLALQIRAERAQRLAAGAAASTDHAADAGTAHEHDDFGPGVGNAGASSSDNGSRSNDLGGAAGQTAGQTGCQNAGRGGDASKGLGVEVCTIRAAGSDVDVLVDGRRPGGAFKGASGI